MSTKMTDEDWANALTVFRAALPRRGAKGHDDRLFLEALHYFSIHNVSWRALPGPVRQTRTGLSMPRDVRVQAAQRCRHSSRAAVRLSLKMDLLERLRSLLK